MTQGTPEDETRPAPPGDTVAVPAPGPEATPSAAAPPACANCGTELLGPHCYRCGQPIKGLVRHFTSIIGDFLDSVFDFDSRTLRTLWPLYTKPGYLACEYFEGRRVRYVSPVRLFFFLTIVAFFIGSLTLHVEGDGVDIGDDGDRIARAMTVEEVERLRDTALGSLPDEHDELGRPVPSVEVSNEIKRQALEGRAAKRIADIRKAEADGTPVAPGNDDEPTISFGGGKWDPETNPLEVSFLPAFANAWLNAQVGRAERNIARLQEEPDLYVKALLSAIPTSLFVLMPVFALMLKLAYVFKRRLYMEHLIVALHSHAFLSLSLLLLFILEWIGTAWPATESALKVPQIAIFAWMPIYLLLMQKRVYRQGWPMTLLKYLMLGFVYFWLTTIAAVVAALASLVWM